MSGGESGHDALCPTLTSMHEASITLSLIEVAQDVLRENGGRVTALTVRIGQWSAVVPQALRAAFPAAAAATPLEGSHLSIVRTAGVGECPSHGPVTLELAKGLRCPLCGAPTPKLLEGDELELDEMENDAARLRQWGAQAEQIVTGTICHLDASMVQQVLPRFDLGKLDVLFLENVGNLVCPSSYALGEAARAVLISTTEGEDKPLKYPTIFNTADVVVITKMDIAQAVEFDLALCRENIDRARPGVKVIELSSKKGTGLEEWYAFVRGG